MPADPNLEYCRQSLKNSDYDHYLISLFMKPYFRPALWALGAFKNVIETIPASISDPTFGYMRLTWWRDQIELLEQGSLTKGQPILSALSVIAREQRDRGNPELLERLVDFINEHEALIETPNPNFVSIAYPQILQSILGAENPKYQKLENAMTAIMKKYHGTKWEQNPPLLALRLWLKS